MRIVALRKKKKMSQESLCENANISRVYVSRLETAQANPTVLVLKKIADILDVNVIDLLANTEI